MERHASHPSFHAVAVTAGTATTGTATTGTATTGTATTMAGTTGTGTTGASRPGRDGPWPAPPPRPSPIIAFAYGFHGENGQWWHDLVRDALGAAGGRGYAQAWLSDAFEVAEVHVHPDHQGRGIGRAIVLGLTRPRLERTAVLSTQDSDSPARRLYRRLGFADLLTRFSFPGTDPPYAVMGAVLPLRGEPLPAPGSAPS